MGVYLGAAAFWVFRIFISCCCVRWLAVAGIWRSFFFHIVFLILEYQFATQMSGDTGRTEHDEVHQDK